MWFLVRFNKFEHTRGGLGKPDPTSLPTFSSAKMLVLEDVEMEKLRVIFSHAILGRGETSSPPTAGFIEFLQIISRLDWMNIGGEVLWKGW